MTILDKILNALDNSERYLRARFMFDLMEDERRKAVEEWRKYQLETEVKLIMLKLKPTSESMTKWIENYQKELRAKSECIPHPSPKKPQIPLDIAE